jgi:hypothetical protein
MCISSRTSNPTRKRRILIDSIWKEKHRTFENRSWKEVDHGPTPTCPMPLQFEFLALDHQRETYLPVRMREEEKSKLRAE